MLKLVLDPEKVRELLAKKKWSYDTIASQIKIVYQPTDRILEEWLRGNVTLRWRVAVAEALNVSVDDISPTKKKTAARILKNVPIDKLRSVKVADAGITRAAIGSWIDGGGIDIERLLAVAKLFDVAPHELLSQETKDLLAALSSADINASEADVRKAMF